MNENQPVWDLPVRLFHWSIAALIGLSWWSADKHFDHIHFASGYTLLFLLAFRIFWGFFGSSTARFAAFIPGPSKLIAYLRDGQSRQAGHTPLGALSVVAMLLALPIQIASGLIQIADDDFIQGPLAGLVSYDAAVFAHKVHETSFDILLGLVGLHLLAIAYHCAVRRRSLVRAMVTGRTSLPDGVSPMMPARKGRLAACLVAALAVVSAILGIGRVFAG